MHRFTCTKVLDVSGWTEAASCAETRAAVQAGLPAFLRRVPESAGSDVYAALHTLARQQTFTRDDATNAFVYAWEVKLAWHECAHIAAMHRC